MTTAFIQGIKETQLDLDRERSAVQSKGFDQRTGGRAHEFAAATTVETRSFDPRNNIGKFGHDGFVLEDAGGNLRECEESAVPSSEFSTPGRKRGKRGDDCTCSVQSTL
jgi:hypothetical protein